ncbi:MAG: prepilin-type N-terminal cleavage/methylation domain-containing protein [Neptuniibacter sp.]
MTKPVAEKGFSLVEVVITIVIIGIALVAAISGWSNIARHSADVMWQSKVAYLGQAYIEEILSRRFDENTPIGGGACTPSCSDETSEFGVTTASGPYTSKDGESRENFDDVDDYHGINENAVGLFVGLIGQVQAYDNYTVTVDVSYVGSTYLSGSNDLLKRIQVTVTPPANTGQSPVVFSAIKGSY